MNESELRTSANNVIQTLNPDIQETLEISGFTDKKVTICSNNKKLFKFNIEIIIKMIRFKIIRWIDLPTGRPVSLERC